MRSLPLISRYAMSLQQANGRSNRRSARRCRAVSRRPLQPEIHIWFAFASAEMRRSSLLEIPIRRIAISSWPRCGQANESVSYGQVSIHQQRKLLPSPRICGKISIMSRMLSISFRMRLRDAAQYLNANVGSNER